MQKWDIIWSDEFLCGNEKIDSAHRFIIEKGTLLHQKIKNPPHNNEELFDLAMELANRTVEHMDTETEWMKEFGLNEYKAHKEDHDLFKSKFDLNKKYDLSKKLRLLMIADMLAEYMNYHFYKFDMIDLRKVSNIIKDKRNK